MRKSRRSYHMSESRYVRQSIRPQLNKTMLELGYKKEAREHPKLGRSSITQITRDHLKEDARYYDYLLPSAYRHSD